MISYPFGLYGNGMHDFILTEMEVGTRVAMAQDSEDCGFGAIFDLQYQEYVDAHSNDPDPQTTHSGSPFP